MTDLSGDALVIYEFVTDRPLRHSLVLRMHTSMRASTKDLDLSRRIMLHHSSLVEHMVVVVDCKQYGKKHPSLSKFINLVCFFWPSWRQRVVIQRALLSTALEHLLL